MTRQLLIKKTIENLSRLPDSKIVEVSDFAEFLLNRVEGHLLTRGIQKMMIDSETYKFLEEEQDIYSVEDCKERYK